MDMGGDLQLYVAKSDTVTKSISLTELLKQSGLLDNSINPESYVTPASLSRILVAMSQK